MDVTSDIFLLSLTAASIGLFHTLLGPDHYLPFIVMSRARGWSMPKTAWITFLCGAGHVLSSVLIGVFGIAFGVGVMKLEALEGFRGNIAAWLLIGFGLAYFVWGVRRAVRNRPHRHLHVHSDRSVHSHRHAHDGEHAHVHEADARRLTPWVLFTIFVFGPCEPLIPILMYPAAKSSLAGMAVVTAIFAVATIGTKLSVVMAGSYGLGFVRLGKIERYSHALAGGTICLCGLAIEFLGL